MPSQKDIKTGLTFNRLTAVRFLRKRNSKDFWLFKCECGKTKEAYAYNVACGRTRSCGCYAKEVFKDSNKKFKLPTGEASKRQLFLAYKQGANKRDFKFSIDLKTFERLTSGDCHYCGVPPSNTTTRGKLMPTNGEYIYNGIDRVDSSKGYIADNTVSCCTTCNYAKHTLSYDEFMQWIDRLVNFHTERNTDA